MSTAGQPPGVDVMISKADRDTIVAAGGTFNATTGVPTTTVNVTIKNDNQVIARTGRLRTRCRPIARVVRVCRTARLNPT